MHSSVEVYDPDSDRWGPTTEMQDGRSGFAASVINGRIYVAGGEVLVSPFHALDTVEVYDPSTETWRRVAPLPTTLHGIRSAAHDGRMFVFGGAEDPASAGPQPGDVLVFDPNRGG